MSPLIKDPYNFYEVQTFKGHESKFEPNQIISLQIYLNEATVANFQNNRKIWILCVDKALFSDGKNNVQAKQWLDKYYSDSAPSETTIKSWYADLKCGRIDTNDAKSSGHPNSAVARKTPKKTPQIRFGQP